MSDDQKESAASLTIEYADTVIPAGVRVGELTIDGRGWPSGNHHFHVWQIPGGGLIAFPTVLSTPKRAKQAFADLASAPVEPWTRRMGGDVSVVEQFRR